MVHVDNLEKVGMNERLHFSATSWREQVTFWDDDTTFFVLEQHAEQNLYSLAYWMSKLLFSYISMRWYLLCTRPTYLAGVL